MNRENVYTPITDSDRDALREDALRLGLAELSARVRASKQTISCIIAGLPTRGVSIVAAKAYLERRAG